MIKRDSIWVAAGHRRKKEIIEVAIRDCERRIELKQKAIQRVKKGE